MTTDSDSCEKDVGFATLWKDFSQNTGFHAFNKLYPQRNIRFFWWSLVVLGMAGYLIYTVVAELNNYYSYPMMTGFRTETKDEIAFPAVTICNQCPLIRSALPVDAALENYFLSLSIMGGLAKPINWSDTATYGEFYTKEHSVDWWREKYGKIEGLSKMCMFGTKPAMCSEILIPVFTESGLCYTFNGNASNKLNVSLSGANNNFVVLLIAGQDDYVYNMQSSAGFKILLHEPEEHPDSVQTGILTSPGTATYISVKKTQFKYMPPPFKAFGERECLDTTSDSFNNTLKYHDHYTYEHCLLECAAQVLFERCGCVMPNDPPLGPICSFKTQYECYKPILKFFITNATVQALCQCKHPCRKTTYNVQVSSAAFPSQLWSKFLIEQKFVPDETYIRNNALEVRIFYDQMMVEIVEQEAVYKTSTIVANLGGQMGICLGASILTLTELGEFFVFLFLYLLNRYKPQTVVKKISIQN